MKRRVAAVKLRSLVERGRSSFDQNHCAKATMGHRDFNPYIRPEQLLRVVRRGKSYRARTALQLTSELFA